MDMSNDAWQMIKKTPKVTGFVGGGTEPIPFDAGRGRHAAETDRHGRGHAAAEGRIPQGR